MTQQHFTAEVPGKPGQRSLFPPSHYSYSRGRQRAPAGSGNPVHGPYTKAKPLRRFEAAGEQVHVFSWYFGGRTRTRTLDLLIKSQRVIPRNQSDQLAGAPGCFVELKFVF
jgi:hypothetical protein